VCAQRRRAGVVASAQMFETWVRAGDQDPIWLIVDALDGVYHESRPAMRHVDQPLNGDPLKGGELNAALTSAIVGIHTNHLGRGPSSASTFHNENVVAVLMRDVMTQVEKTLSRSGNGQAVSNMRHLYQQTMADEFKAAVERLTGRKVVAFISGNHVDPDIAVELFILDGAPGGD
jgi:uncharacterized protein YbcI